MCRASEAALKTVSERLQLIPSARLEFARDVTSGRSGLRQILPSSEPITRWLPVFRLAFIGKVVSGLSVKANVGRYSRLPSTTELYGNTGFLLGNPALTWIRRGYVEGEDFFPCA